MSESLCCAPETISTVLTGYTPIQKKKVFKKIHYIVQKNHKYILGVLRRIDHELEKDTESCK